MDLQVASRAEARIETSTSRWWAVAPRKSPPVRRRGSKTSTRRSQCLPLARFFGSRHARRRIALLQFLQRLGIGRHHDPVNGRFGGRLVAAGGAVVPRPQQLQFLLIECLRVLGGPPPGHACWTTSPAGTPPERSPANACCPAPRSGDPGAAAIPCTDGACQLRRRPPVVSARACQQAANSPLWRRISRASSRNARTYSPLRLPVRIGVVTVACA